jgi:hypothetical protein
MAARKGPYSAEFDIRGLSGQQQVCIVGTGVVLAAMMLRDARLEPVEPRVERGLQDRKFAPLAGSRSRLRVSVSSRVREHEGATCAASRRFFAHLFFFCLE